MKHSLGDNPYTRMKHRIKNFLPALIYYLKQDERGREKLREDTRVRY